MDNDLISVDDLVRQRLTGGEEREPSGAWLRMRELLDKEDDRKPVGFIWRRMFGGLAILILIASISVGGYELTSSSRNLNGDNNAPITAAAIINATSGHATNNTKQSPKTVIAEINQQKNNEATNNETGNNSKAVTEKPVVASHRNLTHKTVNTDNINTTEAASSGYHAPHNSKPNADNAIASTTNVPDGNSSKSKSSIAGSKAVAVIVNRLQPNNNKTNNSHASKDAVNGKLAGNNKLAAVNTTFGSSGIVAPTNNDQGKTKISPAGSATTGNGAIAKSGTNPGKQIKHHGKKGISNEAIATDNNSKTIDHPVLAAAPSDNHMLAAVPDQSNAEGIASGNNKSGNSKSGIAGSAHNKTNNKKAAKIASSTGKNTAGPSSKLLAAADNTTPATKHSKATGLVATDKKQAVANKKAAVTGAKATGDNTHGKVAATNKTHGQSISKPIAISGAAHLLAGNAKSIVKVQSIAAKTDEASKGVNSRKLPSGSHAIAAKGVSGMKETNGIAAKSGTGSKKNNRAASSKNKTNTNASTAVAATKTTGNKIAARSSAPSQGPTVTPPAGNQRMARKVIQTVTISENYIKTSPNTFFAHFDTISIGSMTQETALADDNADAAPIALNNGADASATNNPGNTPPVPEAAPPADKASAGTNANEHTTKKSGGNGVTGLQNAFNDIKYKIGGAQFAMGLTGGINSTFFGPNSFKGFQFGVTGNFIFSESLNVMAELKYFQRANNDYTLNDNYYNYTPNASGSGYTKEEVLNPYSFSTLHSFELPLIIRYTVGKFNFFAGGNLVYSLAINEAQGLPTTVQTPIPAMSIGNDNAPKIEANDFNARFGLGYLFGASVQLSPAMSIDLRDVQTFWDNAGTPGAKEVSTQLYKSPSFQLSLGYRFGGRKGKDKE